MGAFTSAALTALFSPAVARRVRAEVFPVLPSTNAAVKACAVAGENEGLLLIAEEQSAGYGRFARRFVSPAGVGLYMSILLRPRVGASLLPRITSAAAVATAEAIESFCGERVGIKWVNDIYKDGKKICGILTEGSLAPDGTPAYAVLGIGVDLAPSEGEFPPEVQRIAGAVFPDGKMPGNARERLCAAILDRFFPYYDALSEMPFLASYRARSVLTGKRITVYKNTDGEKTDGIPAIAEGIDDGFRLLVRYPDGTKEALAAGECSLTLL